MNKILANSEEVKQGHLQNIKVNTITANSYVGISGISIYDADGTLTGNRTVTTNTNNLTFVGTNNDIVINDGALTANNLTGTLTTAVQPNVTNIGTQTDNLNMGGNNINNVNSLSVADVKVNNISIIKSLVNNNLSSWTAETAAENNEWYNIAWSPDLNLLCAVSVNGTNRVMTSPDGINWTARAAAENNEWRAVTWSSDLTLFCAVASSGTNRVMTSPDGINWTSRTAAENNDWYNVAWSPELLLFCAVSVNGTNRVMTSPDGVNWTARAAAELNEWRYITWSPELTLFCAVATVGTNRVMTSPDGINWTARATPENNEWRAVAWSPELNLFCAVAGSGTNRVMTSSNGINWTVRTAAENNDWYNVAWSPELLLFCAVSLNGTNRVMTSPDGINWTARAAAENNGWISVVWSPELYKFVAVSLDGTNRVMYSDTGQELAVYNGDKGYQDRIKLAPTMFIIDDDAESSVRWDDSESKANGVQVANVNNELYGTVCIPFGYKATGFYIYCNNTITIKIFDCDFSSIDSVLKGEGDTNTLVSMTDTPATETNYLLIDVGTTSTADRIRGGYITIERI